MSDVIEFAKILRRIVRGNVWQGAFGRWSIDAWMLDAAIEEFGKRPAGQSYLLLCPRGHAVKYRRDDEESVIYPVEYCERCKESRGREESRDRDAEVTQARPVADVSPAPSLDDLRAEYERDIAENGYQPKAHDYIAHLESALAAAETEVARLNKGCGYWEAEVARLNAECAHWMSKWGKAQDRIAVLESRRSNSA